MHAIGYGAMLAEGLVAVLALSTVMVMSADDLRGLKPGTIYGNGLGEFLTLIIGKENLPFAITFGAMAFSTFVFDTIDVATRLGRYLIQELTGLKTLFGATLATLVTVGAPALVLSMAGEGSYTLVRHHVAQTEWQARRLHGGPADLRFGDYVVGADQHQLR